MLGSNKYIITPLIFCLALLISIAGIFIPIEETDANGIESINVTITTPENGDEITYCTNFTVSANITTPVTTYDVDVWIEVTGNASLVSGDTDGTPETYNYGMI